MPDEMLRVTVVFSPAPRQVFQWILTLPVAAVVRDALLTSGLPDRLSEAELARARVGIWGRKCGRDTPLRDQDRVEVYRPLRVDPKVARRERFRKQGARAAGLFAARRPGAKPGY